MVVIESIEAANGGVLLLDEMGELPLEQQVKLLHVLQEKTLIKLGVNQSTISHKIVQYSIKV